MIQDDVVWRVINQGHCAFKTKTITQNFCRNEYNLTGLCNRHSCPLANSRYATVMEHKGHCFLYMKTIERAHLPSKQWEKVKLPKNYRKALELIDEQLEFWGKFQRHKCKQRLTKLHQMIIRQRKLKISSMHTQEKMVTINKKYEKREFNREKGAEKAAQLERAIEKELVQRLKSGTFYPQEVYNLNQKVFLDTIGKEEVADLEEAQEYEIDEEVEEEYNSEDIDEDELAMLEDEEENDDNLDLEDQGSDDQAEKLTGKKRPRVKIGYEEEEESALEYEYEEEDLQPQKKQLAFNELSKRSKVTLNSSKKKGALKGLVDF